MPACLLALTIFCLPVEDAAIEIRKSPLLAFAQFERGWVAHRIVFYDDDLRAAGEALESAFCTAGQRGRYSARYMDVAGTEVRRLILEVRREGDPGPSTIILDAENDEQIAAALESIRVMDDQGDAGVTLGDLVSSPSVGCRGQRP